MNENGKTKEEEYETRNLRDFYKMIAKRGMLLCEQWAVSSEQWAEKTVSSEQKKTNFSSKLCEFKIVFSHFWLIGGPMTVDFVTLGRHRTYNQSMNLSMEKMNLVIVLENNLWP